MSLHPLHREDLYASGLTDRTIADYGIRSVPPRDMKKILTPALYNQTHSLLQFPYPNLKNEFSRYKLFPSHDKMKYYQPRGTGIHLYITREALSADEIYLTEGEKKTLKLAQDGYPSIGLGGVWSFKTEDWDLIRARKIIYIPDSDSLTNDHIKQSVGALSSWLEEQGRALSWKILKQA